MGTRIGVLLRAIAGAYLTVDLIFAYRDDKGIDWRRVERANDPQLMV